MKKRQAGFSAIFWLFLIFFLIAIGATGFMAWYNRMTAEKGPDWFPSWLQNWVNQPAPTPLVAEPTSSEAEPTLLPTVSQSTTPQENLFLNVSFKPEVVPEEGKQKLTLEIKNETGWVLIIKEAKIDWYYNSGQGFYLAESQQIGGNDLHWLATKVPEWSSKTVYQEESNASGRGDWRGEITVVTNLKNLMATVTHTIQ